NFDQHVKVVFHTSDLMHENPVLFADARQVGPQSSLRLFRTELAPLLGAEHHVDGVMRRNGTCVAPPALRRWRLIALAKERSAPTKSSNILSHFLSARAHRRGMIARDRTSKIQTPT